MRNSANFNKKLLSALVAACCASGAYAQGELVEEVVVTGVRGAQEQAIDIKRNSTEIVDSVAAEDIGKLPDTTIADSLQRITGIQISRQSGQEGGEVSVRGLKQVLPTLNGELFLTAKGMKSNGADFTDIPSSLVSGMNVYKSQSATNIEGGVGASIDLMTKRSLMLDDGLTLAGNLKGSRGSISKSNDPEISGLIGWKFNDSIATSLALSYSEVSLADNRAQLNPDLAVESSWGCGTAPCRDLDGDGQLNSEVINPASWNSSVQSRLTERERLGLAYNFNMAISESLELNADVMYNDITEKAAGQSLFFTNGFDRAKFHETGSNFPEVKDGSDLGRTGYATEANVYISSLLAGIVGDFRESDALNTNLELKFDSGDAFTGSVRWVHGEAESTGDALNLSAVTYAREVDQTNNGIVDPVNINPGAINNGNIYLSNLRLDSESVHYTVDPALAELASNPSAWYIHSAWVDGGDPAGSLGGGGNQEADFDAVRFDGAFKFAETGLTSVDFGLRIADRSTTNKSYSFFSPSGYVVDGVDLLNKYHEAGYALGQAGVPGGTAEGAEYDPMPVFTFDNPKLDGYIRNVSDFGEAVKGLDLTIPVVDVSKIDDPVAFLDYLYGEGQQILNPDRSYHVEEEKKSFHIKFNFESDVNDYVTMSGNAGLRYVKVDLEVIRSITDSSQLNPLILAGVDPNHTTYVDLGKESTKSSYNYALPSINTTFSFGEDWKIRAAYNETVSLQNLDDLGQGTITYYDSEQDGENFQRVNSKQNNGNPTLEPWSAGIFSLAAEWYPTESSLLTIGYFNMDIESFTYRASEFNADLPDSDGEVRTGAPEYTLVNGEGGLVHGYEFAYQQSFDFLPGILANTGMTFNYTYSPSKGSSTNKLANGDVAPLGQTAEDQANLILWYQDDRFQARIAANYLSAQYDSQQRPWVVVNPNGADRWIKSQMFVDLSTSYNITDNIQVSLAVNNLLEENQIQYDQWEDNISQYDIYERRITAGVNAKF